MTDPTHELKYPPTSSPLPESDARDPDADAIVEALVRAALDGEADPLAAAGRLADRVVALLGPDADEVRRDIARESIEDVAAAIADERHRRQRNGKTPTARRQP